MDFVKNRNNLQVNADTLYDYLIGNNVEKQIFAKNLIKRGRNFVIHKIDTELRFYPSRFMGYKDNTQEKHDKSRDEIRLGLNKENTVHGRKTDRHITSILGNHSESDEMDSEYRKFCKKYGIETNQTKKHKFWLAGSLIEGK